MSSPIRSRLLFFMLSDSCICVISGYSAHALSAIFYDTPFRIRSPHVVRLALGRHSTSLFGFVRFSTRFSLTIDIFSPFTPQCSLRYTFYELNALARARDTPGHALIIPRYSTRSRSHRSPFSFPHSGLKLRYLDGS